MSGVDKARIEKAVLEILLAIGENPEREGLQDTPRRVAEAYEEFFSGMNSDPRGVLSESILGRDGEVEAQNTDRSQLVLVCDIEFRSMCEHHLLPFVGVAHIAYLPDKKVLGLGRFSAALHVLASRPNMQERLTDEFLDALVSALQPRGAFVVLDAVHRCVVARGSKQHSSSTVTLSSMGSLNTAADRAEVLSLIALRDTKAAT